MRLARNVETRTLERENKERRAREKVIEGCLVELEKEDDASSLISRA